MSDDDLKNYLPHEGDRVTVKSYALRSLSGPSKPSSDSQESRKEALRKKIAKSMAFSEEETLPTSRQARKEKLLASVMSKSHHWKRKCTPSMSTASLKRGEHARKEDIAIDVGLSLFEDKEKRFKQVRSNHGGGIRYLRLVKPVYKTDIIADAISAFFPEGEGFYGQSKDFLFDLAGDVAGTHKFHEVESAEEFMHRLKMKKVRCYLLATRSDPPADSSEEESTVVAMTDTQGDSSQFEDFVTSETTTFESTSVNHPVSTTGSATHVAENVIVVDGASPFLMSKESYQNVEPFQSAILLPTDVTLNASLPSVSLEDNQAFENQDTFQDEALRSSQVQSDPRTSVDISPHLIEEDMLVRRSSSVDPEIQLLSGRNSPCDDLDDTVPVCLEIEVHRGSVCHDLINYFSCQENVDAHSTSFEIVMLKQDGTREVAEDNGGVLRDAMTEFLESFYLQYTVGNDYVVPVLRHDMTKENWMAVAAVFRMALKQENIFPVKIAPPFMHQAIFGECDKDLLEPFMKFIPNVDSSLLQEALRDIESVDQDDLLDFMERHEAKQLPTEQNLRRLMKEIAHKEIIQTPLFVADSWGAVFRSLKLSKDQVDDMYRNLIPTTKKVLKMLAFPESADSFDTSLTTFVKRLVREMDCSLLSTFLRFCTGSDLAVRDRIQIRFTQSQIRCPTSHTCGCVLEIPRLYATEPYVTFKSEFTSVLKSKYLQMDIV